MIDPIVREKTLMEALFKYTEYLNKTGNSISAGYLFGAWLAQEITKCHLDIDEMSKHMVKN